MKLKINLSFYSLNFLFGSRVFEDEFLLSREVMKKAYQEKLYFISSKENIEKIKNEKNATLLVFAGIPTFSQVCGELSPTKKLYALKICLDYADLANFKQEKNFLVKENVQIESLEEKTLSLVYQNHLEYIEEDVSFDLEPFKEEIIKDFIKEMKEYYYGIKNKLEYLEEQLKTFLNSKESYQLLENEETLQEIKEIYEMLIFINL